MVRKALTNGYGAAKKTLVALIGATALMLGLVMIFLPGPGALVVLLGLGILGMEFAWARRLLHSVREWSEGTLRRLRALRPA